MNQPALLRDIHGVANVLNSLNCGEARPRNCEGGRTFQERRLCGGLRSSFPERSLCGGLSSDIERVGTYAAGSGPLLFVGNPSSPPPPLCHKAPSRASNLP